MGRKKEDNKYKKQVENGVGKGGKGIIDLDL